MTENPKLVLITGASGGIGADLAELCVKEGYDVALVARNEVKLAEVKASLASVASQRLVFLIPTDLSKNGAAKHIVEEVQKLGRSVDVLINNAGVGTFGLFTETELTSTLSMINLNVNSLVDLTHRCLPEMVARGSGKILNVASTAAFQPGPLMAVYYATKAFVLSFSEALGNELDGTGVTVTALCPGPTKTGFQAAAKMERSKLLEGPHVMSSKDVAVAGFRAMIKGKSLIIPGATNKTLAQVVRFAPRRLVTRIVRKMQDSISH